MILSRLQMGGQERREAYVTRTGGTTINQGAVLIAGTTDGTNLGMAIVGAAPYTNVVGVTPSRVPTALSTINTPAYVDSSQVTPVDTQQELIVNPDAAFFAEYDQTSTLTGTSSGTTLTITSLAGTLAGGWIYVVAGSTGSGTNPAGTNCGLLLAIKASTSGSCTLYTAPAVALDGTETLIKIQPRFTQLVNLNTTADKIASVAAAATGKISILENYFRAPGYPDQKLLPTKHTGLVLPNVNTVLNPPLISPVFYSEITFQSWAFGPSTK